MSKTLSLMRKPSGRRIVVDGVTYYWKGSDVVEVRTEEGKTFCRVRAEDLLGCSPYDWERGQRKRTLNIAITPRLVANWIKEKRVAHLAT